MPISKSEVSYLVDVDMPEGLTAAERDALLEEIGDYTVTSMLDFIGEGKSPVTGRNFQKLSAKYADKEKGGSRVSNLELDGDMLDALDFEITKGKLKVGIFDEDQAIKAYGHQTGFEGHPWLDGKAPARQILPDKGEDFVGRIKSGIDDIIEEFMDGREN